MKVILFDGVCNLCNGAVNWVIDHDRKNLFHFSALQSDYGAQLLKNYQLPESYLDTFILDDDGVLFYGADAALKVLRYIGGVYSSSVLLYVFPSFIRNAVYKYIANHRYRWFGKRETCRVPTPELKQKFL